MKKFLCVVLVLMLTVGCVFTFAACNNNTKYNKELISNGSFESSDSSASYWRETKAITSDSDGALNIVGYGGDSEESYLTVKNTANTGNYVKLFQEVEVSRNAVYKITAKVKNIEIKQGSDDAVAGAGLEIVDNATVLTQSSEVTGEWTLLTAYVKPKNVNKLTVAIIFGNAEAKTIGTVAFDEVSMVRVKVNDVPADASVVSVRIPRTPDYANSTIAATLLVVFLAIITVVLILGAYVAYRKYIDDDKPLFNKTWMTVALLTLSGLALRLILAGTLFDKGGAAALRATIWSTVDLGIGQAGMTMTSYSPFQLYYMWIVGKATRGYDNLASFNVVAQLLPIVCDCITIAVIYAFAKKYVNDKQAALFGALYAFLPVAFIVSAGYSIEIPVLTMLFAVTFYALIEKDYITLMAGSLITCLWSPFGIYVLPFIVVYEIYIMAKTKDKNLIITFCVGWFVSFWLFILLSAGAVSSMFKAGHILYVVKNYYIAMFEGQVCVSNAFNLYALFGLNGGAVNNSAFWLNIVFSIILLIYTVSLYFKNYNRAEMTLVASFFLTVMAVFSLNMDETALILGLVMLLMYIIISGEERLFWVFGLLAFMALINTGIVLNYNGALNETFRLVYFNKGDAGYAIANVMSACIVLFYGWVVYDITTNGKLKLMQPLPAVNPFTKQLVKED